VAIRVFGAWTSVFSAGWRWGDDNHWGRCFFDAGAEIMMSAGYGTICRQDLSPRRGDAKTA
jgi:hypothetical protein